MTPIQIGRIMETLRECGVSPFNVIVGSDGMVIFHSRGLTAAEISHAQFELVKCLLRIRSDAVQK